MADSNENPVSSFQEASLKNEQDEPVEPDSPMPSQSIQSKESPLILEKFDDNNQQGVEPQQEGIGDAFSKNHGDRFQSKAEGRPPNEKINKVQSDKEIQDAQK